MSRHAPMTLFAGRGALNHVQHYLDDRELLTSFENRARYIEQSRRTKAGAPAALPHVDEVPNQSFVLWGGSA